MRMWMDTGGVDEYRVDVGVDGHREFWKQQRKFFFVFLLFFFYLVLSFDESWRGEECN